MKFLFIIFCWILYGSCNLDTLKVKINNFYPPAEMCDYENQNAYTGIEYYMAFQAALFLNKTTEKNEIFYCEAALDLVDWDPNNLVYYGGWTITSDRIYTVYNFSQPTMTTGLALAAKITRTNWLFFKVLSWQAVVSIIFFCITSSLVILILEDQSVDFKLLFTDVCSSFFMNQDFIMHSASAKITRFIMMLIALIITSIYVGFLVQKYNDVNTVNGLTEPGALFDQKIFSYGPYLLLTLQYGISSINFDAYEFSQVQQMFSDGTIDHYLFDQGFLEVLSEIVCDVYVIQKNILSFYYAGIYGTIVDKEGQREWDSGMIYARETLLDSKMIQKFANDEYAEINQCLNKRKIDLLTYSIYDFYELWIVYLIIAVFTSFFWMVSKVVNKLKKYYGKYVHESFIRGPSEKYLLENIKQLYLMNMLPGLMMVKLCNKEKFMKIKKRVLLKKCRFTQKMTDKINTANTKMVRVFAKRKMLKQLVQNKLNKISLAKKLKLIRDHPKKLFRQQKLSRYTKFNKLFPLVRALIFDNFLKICYRQGILKEFYSIILIQEYSGPKLRVDFKFENLHFVYSKLDFSYLQGICMAKTMLYCDFLYKIHSNAIKTEAGLIAEKFVNEYFSGKIKSSFETLYLIKKNVAKFIKQNKLEKNGHRIQKLLVDDVLENYKLSGSTQFQQLNEKYQRAIRSGLKPNLHSLEVKGKRGEIHLQTKQNLTVIFKKTIPKKRRVKGVDTNQFNINLIPVIRTATGQHEFNDQ